ncbi:MAG TPA: acyl-CoA dehydrogenase family protein [Acidimicrobiales bacterium]|nr:acyl-CoA dehydrogenase family protein [Acidimicrobiales bacterium]
MDFTFSPEQEEMRASVRAFLAKFAADGQVRAMLDDPRGFADAWWEEVTDLGWPGLLVPERLGGSGLGMVDLSVVQEECGRLPLPGPFFSSSVCATLAVLRLGEEDLARRLATGQVRATLALEEGGIGDPLDSVRVSASPDGAGWRVDGVKQLVLDGHTADLAVVVARDADGLAAFLVDEPAATPVPTLDVTRKAARLELEGRAARRLGPPGDQTALLARVRDDIDVALCAETVGAAERALELAIDYSKSRVQFDRPIATFQAIKHKIVDMLHQLELGRVGTHWAAWASEVDDPQREAAAAMCKAFVAEAANMVTAESIQVHGGVGFTWDVDCHLLFRRVKQNDVLFGGQSWQRRRLADLVIGGGSADDSRSAAPLI